MTRHALALLSLLLLAAPAAASTAQSIPRDIDRTIERTMKLFEVPGLSVAVVHDGRTLLEKGYGVRRMGVQTRVDASTIFGIASNTKAFTAASLAILVDEGKIAWDDRVIDHLPAFQMYDPYVTREMTIRDLLVHRSGLGLGAGDLLWWPATTYTKEEIVSRLRHVKPATSFRSRYAYDNVLYLVAGEVVEAVSGTPWDRFVAERIFVPLGMSNSNISFAALAASDNAAAPHMKVEGLLQPITPASFDNVKPAAAINSSAADLAKWMRVQLARGAITGDRRLFSEKESREMWMPQVVTPSGSSSGPLAPLRSRFSAYALGWGVREYRGELVVSHTGVVPGYFSRVLLLPERNLGIAVLTNQQEGGAHGAIAYTILDAMIGTPLRNDWPAAFKAAAEEARARGEEEVKKLESSRNSESKPSLPLASYSGSYRDAWYGEATVTFEDGLLVLRFSRTQGLVADLEHWQYDTFAARWRDRTLEADAFTTFVLDHEGRVDQMKMRAISPLTDFSFDFHDLEFSRNR
jgi:CubicO group peptidase (beta-lactamase class C family)